MHYPELVKRCEPVVQRTAYPGFRLDILRPSGYPYFAAMPFTSDRMPQVSLWLTVSFRPGRYHLRVGNACATNQALRLPCGGNRGCI